MSKTSRRPGREAIKDLRRKKTAAKAVTQREAGLIAHHRRTFQPQIPL